MGKPNIRLNPKVESVRSRILLERGAQILISCALALPAKEYAGRGRKPYDYRVVLVLSILMVLLRKRYADYETEMRTDKRIIDMLGIRELPCKSTINNYVLHNFTLAYLSVFNKNLVDKWLKKPVDLLLDASGIRLVGRSIWFCIRTKQRIRKKDCDKVHIAVSLCSLLVTNFRITNSKRNDSPFLRKMLRVWHWLGLVIVDKGYSNETNALFVVKRDGSFFCPFKKNANPDYFSYWGKLYRLWQRFPSICRGIYNQRSKVEAVFSALKKRYGDQLHGKKCKTRRREMAMRFIAYNVKIIVGIQIARQLNVPLWVRAK